MTTMDRGEMSRVEKEHRALLERERDRAQFRKTWWAGLVCVGFLAAKIGWHAHGGEFDGGAFGALLVLFMIGRFLHISQVVNERYWRDTLERLKAR